MLKYGALVGLATYGVVAGVRFWQKSPWIQVTSVRFVGDIPPALEIESPVRVGENIITLRPGRLEKAILQQFPELDRLSVHRQWNRSVVIEGAYKTPVALLEEGRETRGLDGGGRLFPIGEHNQPLKRLPTVTLAEGALDPASVLPPVANSLRRLEKGLPKFYSLLRRLEIDGIGRVLVVLEDGVKIHWGEIDPEEDVLKASRVMRLRENFTPRETPAYLRFVTTERVVMDAHWAPAHPTRKV